LNIWAHPLTDDLAVAAASDVVISSVLVAHLSAGFTTSVLTSFFEAGVPIRPDNTIIQTGSVDVSHAVFCIIPRVVFEKAKATRGFLDFVQTHDNSFNVASLAEQLVQLLLSGVKGEIPNVEGGTELKLAFLLMNGTLELLVPVGAERRGRTFSGNGSECSHRARFSF